MVIVLHIQKQIVYYAVKHNYLLFRNSYMFQSLMTIIGPSIQYLK